MKNALAIALLLASLLPATTLPARADEKQDAFDACLKELTYREGIARSLVLKFSIHKRGTNRYDVTGWNEDGQHVVCVVRNGRVSTVTVG